MNLTKVNVAIIACLFELEVKLDITIAKLRIDESSS